ncbi:MAG: PAS domain-containing protein [bacterium]|nr:PAS domain-containing protein [bacterium]
MSSNAQLSESRSLMCEVTRNAMQDFVYVVDATGRLIDANERFLHEAIKLGASAEGTSIESLIVDEDRSIARRIWQSVAETRKPERSYRKMRNAAGATRVLDVMETAAIANGKVIGVVGVARDISEESALEDRIWDTQENSEAALEYAVRASLGLIKGYVFSLQRMERLPQEQRNRYGKVIVEEIETLSRNIENLLINRGHYDEAGDGELCDVAQIVSEVVTLLRPEAERREIVLQVETSHPEVMLHCHSEAVHRVLLNLVDYCMLRITHRGQVQIRITDSGEYIDITLRDTGQSLSEKDVANLFCEVLPIGSEADSGTVGSRVDLYVARLLCDSLGGGLIARPTADGHMEFAVMFPRQAAIAEGPGTAMLQHQ